MGRKKIRPKFIFQASTLDYLHCLQSMTAWSSLLLKTNNNKKYVDFLKWMLEHDYLRTYDELSITKISKLSGFTTAKISKYLKEIYDDIFDLNEREPDLFCKKGETKVVLHMKYYDNHCYFSISLPIIPRVHERFNFFFAKAKMGWYNFWVKDIQYDIDNNDTDISIFLIGGILNQYREMAVEKAIFEGRISHIEKYDKYDFEIDDIILGRNRDF